MLGDGKNKTLNLLSVVLNVVKQKVGWLTHTSAHRGHSQCSDSPAHAQQSRWCNWPSAAHWILTYIPVGCDTRRGRGSRSCVAQSGWGGHRLCVRVCSVTWIRCVRPSSSGSLLKKTDAVHLCVFLSKPDFRVQNKYTNGSSGVNLNTFHYSQKLLITLRCAEPRVNYSLSSWGKTQSISGSQTLHSQCSWKNKPSAILSALQYWDII